MRVLLVHNYYQQRGGEDTIFEQEVRLLREAGQTVETLIFTNDAFTGSRPGKLRAALLALHNPASARRLNSKISEFRPDVVHIHNLFYTASTAVIWAARHRRVPVVMTLHNYRLVCVSGLLMRPGKIPCETCLTQALPLAGIRHACFRESRLESAHLTLITTLHRLLGTWRSVNRFIVLTEFARQKLLASSLRLRPAQITVKPNAVSAPGYADPDQRTDRFLYVGRLSPEKGISILLEAAGLIDCQIDVLGDGPQAPLTREAADRLPNIHYRGPQPHAEVLDALRRCRALVVPSVCYEGLPTSILEAFATGTPVICSDQQNLNQIVTEGQTGRLFNTGDAADLARVMTAFGHDPDEPRRLGQNGFRTFQTRYTQARSLQTILSVYQEVISE